MYTSGPEVVVEVDFELLFLEQALNRKASIVITGRFHFISYKDTKPA